MDSWNFHQCKLCSYKTRFLKCILSHVREHRTRLKNHRFICNLHSPQQYQCEKCEFQSDLKVHLTEHFDTVHRIKETQHYPTPVLRSCEHCDFQTYSSLVLLSHDSCNHRNGLSEGKGKLHSNQLIHTNEKENDFFHCAICSYKTTTKKSLTSHVLGKHTRRRGKQSKQQIPSHQKNKGFFLTHANQDNYGFFRCNYCSYKTKKNETLKNHVICRHTPADQIDWFKCTYCSYKAKTKTYLRQHVVLKHGQFTNIKRFKCDQCPYETLGKHSMNAHITLCKENSFKCQYCLFRAKYERNLARHILVLHPETVEPKNLNSDSNQLTRTNEKGNEKQGGKKHSNQDENGFFRCSYCSFKSKDRWYLKTHVLCRHTPADQIDWYKCTHCSYKSKTKKLLRLHILSKHIRKIPLEESKGFDRKAKKTAALREHILLKNRHALHPETVRRQKDQLKHKNVGNGFFRCSYCSFKTMNSYYLKSHVLCRHTPADQIDWYKCTHCAYKAKTKKILHNHILSRHIRKIPLEESKGYDRKAENNAASRGHILVKNRLALHPETVRPEKDQLTHASEEGDGLFRCSYCSYETTSSKSLKFHLIGKHRQKGENRSNQPTRVYQKKNGLFLCSDCSYKSKTIRNLKAHKLSKHTDQIDWFKCTYCSFKNMRKSSLDWHMRSFHNNFTEMNRFKCDQISLYLCQKCKYRSKLKVHLTKHLDTVHRAKETQHYPIHSAKFCEMCNFQTYSSLVLLKHVSCCHRSGLPVKDEDSIECGKEKIHSNQLTHTGQKKKNDDMLGHMLSMHSQFTTMERFKCDHCPYETLGERKMKAHMASCKTYSFKCKHCSFKTKYESYLDKHILTLHPEEESELFRCNSCSYKTISSRSLQFHVIAKHRLREKTDSNQPVKRAKKKDKHGYFHCSYCPYKTIYGFYLKTHVIWKHTPSDQVNWYKCNHCSFKTKTKLPLRTHMLLKHSQFTKMKRFKCNRCPYETLEKQNMKAHATLCKYFFKCEHCLFKTKYEGNLNKHVLALHPETVKPKMLKFKSVERNPRWQPRWRESSLPTFKCNNCSFITIRKDQLEKHLRSMHTPSEPVLDKEVLISREHTPPEVNNCLKCELCSYESKQKDDLGRHILTQHMESEKAQVFREGILISS